MRAEVLAIRPILTLGATSNTIRQCSLQAIVVGPDNVHVLVHYDAREPLANSPPHDARLAMMHGETFCYHDRTHVQLKAPDNALKVTVARERQVVRISDRSASARIFRRLARSPRRHAET